jgi:hypothetical protein
MVNPLEKIDRSGAMADSGLDEAVAKMGREFGTLYWTLWQEVVFLHIKWAEYKELFHATPERVNMLNQAAPAFFGTIQEVCREDVILHISRLTDHTSSPGKGSRENLTVQALPDLVQDRESKAAIEHRVQAAVRLSAACKDWRNRHLAHRDLSLALSSYDPAIQVKPLDDMSRKIVSDSVEAIELVLNEASERLTDSSLHFWNVHTRRWHVAPCPRRGITNASCPPGTKVTRGIL